LEGGCIPLTATLLLFLQTIKKSLCENYYRGCAKCNALHIQPIRAIVTGYRLCLIWCSQRFSFPTSELVMPGRFFAKALIYPSYVFAYNFPVGGTLGLSRS